MIFFKKIKAVTFSILPIVVLVLLLHFFVKPITTGALINFLIAVVLVIVGETLFLTGVDSTIMPMGELVGTNIQKVKNLFIFLLFAFLFGMFATVAEPDVQVLTGEIVAFGMPISPTILLFIIGAGVGLFVAFALIRIIRHVPIRVIYLVAIIVIFLVASFVPESFVAVAFDSGGSTVGIVTTPFLLAMTSGVVEKHGNNSSDNFGVIGLAGLGPIIAVLVLSAVLGKTGATAVESQSFGLFLDVLYKTTMAIVPLVALFYLFQILFINLPKQKKIALAVGVVVCFVGLFAFLFGINLGFIGLGAEIGTILSRQPLIVILLFFAAFAFSIVFNEPAIRVLGAQIEAETQGNINRKVIIISMAISMVLAVIVAALRIYFNVNIWYFVGIGYALCALLMLLSDQTFVAIGFDSGGVAGGPITTALILPAMIAMSTTGDGFGFVAITSLVPILVIQSVGVAYNIQTKREQRARKRIMARVAYAAENYSNMEKLEQRYRELKEREESE